MNKSTRFQGAIVREHQLLLLKQAQLSTGRSYWVLPGGRAEPGETEAQCVQREMLEETGLRVEVGDLLLDEQITWGSQNVGARLVALAILSDYSPNPRINRRTLVGSLGIRSTKATEPGCLLPG